MDIATVDFCGFKDVHQGFKDKLMAMLERTLAAFQYVLMTCAEGEDYDQAIRAKLPYCSKATW